MHRFIIRAPLCEGALIDFPAEEAAHAFKVLRLRAGEDIEVSDGEGALFAAELTEVSREIVRARLTERLDSKEPPVSLTLYMGYPKAEKLELIVQKLTELGANRVVPVVMARSVARPDAKDGAKKRERLERIALEAAKQCGRTALVEVRPIEPLQKFLCHAWYEDDMDSEFLFCYENEQNVSVRECLQRTTSERYLLLIGPEGGFTLEEAEAVIKAGGQSVTLGPRILRAETAAIAGLSIVQFEKGDLGS